MKNQEQLYNGITPKNDIIFKRIFGTRGNESILKDFLEGILETKIESVKLGLSTEIVPDNYLGKSSRLDVKTELKDGTIVNVEIQTNPYEYSDKRSLGYFAQLYMDSLKSGESYKEAKKTICIWIVDGEVYDFEKFHSKWVITEEELRKNNIF